MKFNKLMLFSIIMIAILAIGAVSATDLDSVDDMESNDLSIDDSLSVESDTTNNGDAGTEGDNQQVNPKNDNNNVTLPENVYAWDCNMTVDVPDGTKGTFNLSFDDWEPKNVTGLFGDYGNISGRKNIDLVPQINGSGRFGNQVLEPGKNHTLNLTYFDGETVHFSETHTFFLNYIKFEVPEEISTMNGVYQFLNVLVPLNESSEARAALYIDGKQIGYAQPFNGYGGRSIRMFGKENFKGISYGVHSYELRYFNGTYNATSQSGTINVVFDDVEYQKTIVKGSVFNEDIKVNLPFDAFGTLNLIADGKTLVPNQTFYRDDMTTYVFNLSSLDCKDYNATIVYSGDGYYPAYNRTVSFNLDYLMDIYPDSYSNQKNVSDEIYVDLPIDFSIGETLELKVGDKTFYAKSIREEYGSSATFDISQLLAGNYTAQLKYNGNSKYPAKTIDFNLNKYYRIQCNTGHDIFEDTYVTLVLPDDANGTLVIWDDKNYTKGNISIPLNGSNGNKTVDGKEISSWTITSEDGFKIVNCTIPNNVLKLSDPEEHILNFTYIGTDYLVRGTDYDDGDSDSTYISIYPRMNLPIVYAGKDANFTFEMPNDANGRLLVQIEGKTYYNNTLKDGKATFKLPTTQVGDFYFYYEYTGDSKYGDSRTIRDTSTFTVRGKFPKINLTMPTNLVKNCYNTINFTFPGTSFNGNLKLKLDYGNNRYEYVTVPIVKGVGSLKFIPKYQGKLRIYYDYAYKYYEADDECFGDFKVYKLTSKNVTKYYTDSKKLNVTIVDNHNKPVPNGQVVYFYYKGKKIGNATTKNGVASFKLNYKPGTYIIKVYYKGTYVNRKVIVKHIVTFKAVKVKRSAKKLVLTASLKKVNGKYLKGKYITFKFNGKTYKAKTNSKGVAKVTIKRSVLKKLRVGKKIKIQATYLKDTVKRTVKVKR
ncbi:hypothetical protein [uncultured Methanobrevibacter sp.]|uniref:hypothetical protein n=1 Tax=uncultured Methanobrevibacter sp. TaxID=253161 RepID=UPI002606CB19|nr:hypothetical protein [uncultured Methanobrevibacter sp.]